MTKRQTASNVISKKSTRNREVPTKKTQTEEEFEMSENFLFQLFDITEHAVVSTIFPDEPDFFERYLQFYISRRDLFSAKMKENKRKREEDKQKHE